MKYEADVPEKNADTEFTFPRVIASYWAKNGAKKLWILVTCISFSDFEIWILVAKIHLL